MYGDGLSDAAARGRRRTDRAPRAARENVRASDDLEGVARGDVLLRAAHAGLVGRVVEVDRRRRPGACARSGSASGARGVRSLEIGARALDVGLVLGGDGHRLREGVEDDDRRAAEEARRAAAVARRVAQPGTFSIECTRSHAR